MSTPEPEKPKRRRRKKSQAAPPEEAARAELEPTSEDVEAEEAASEVMLEAEAEGEAKAEGEAGAEEEERKPEQPKPRVARRAAASTSDASSARRRRRGRRDPDLPPPVVRAQAKYVRTSSRKARLVCDHIRGKTVEEARAILALTPRAVARDWSKLLESAVANAENNHELVGEDLYVKAVHADEGPTIRRFRPRAMGRATRIRKRTSHLTILLTPKE
jgi:ribosomal protein L22